MIEIEQLTKKYGSFVAVNNLSLSVKAGEIFGFLGVNGAGKTTTLRMLAGVLKPTEGRIKIGGYDIATHASAAKAVTGYIPDRPYVYAKLTAREYLYFICDLYRVPLKVANDRIDSLLYDFGLTEWEDELIDAFSHGMKQRIATCGALVHEPQVLIIDEPMVGLDPHGAKLLKDSLRKYASQGKTIFLSTHSLNVAEEVADRLAIIDHGSLIAMGSLEEIRSGARAHGEGLEHVFLKLTTNIYEH